MPWSITFTLIMIDGYDTDIRMESEEWNLQTKQMQCINTRKRIRENETQSDGCLRTKAEKRTVANTTIQQRNDATKQKHGQTAFLTFTMGRSL